MADYPYKTKRPVFNKFLWFSQKPLEIQLKKRNERTRVRKAGK
jgi:hypothetical protein